MKTSLSKLQVAHFVAHEFAHVTQPKIDRNDDPDVPTIVEGNAETIALLTLAELDPAWQQDAAEKIESAIGRCLMETGAGVWRTNDSRTSGSIPYDCGVAFTVASLLAHKSRDQSSPLQRLLKRNGLPAYSARALLNDHVVTQLAGNESIQTWLTPLLSSITRKRLQAGSMALDARVALDRAVLRDLLAVDCLNSSGFWTRVDHFELDGVSGCKSLKNGMRIASINGSQVLEEPIAASRSARDRCASIGDVLVGLVGGETITVQACSAGFPEHKTVAIDAKKLFGKPLR